MSDQEAVSRKVLEKREIIQRIRDEIGKKVVGQHELVDGLIMGLISKGHILIEGVPGLAKTSAVMALAATVNASFKRIQFMPDLLPADIVGTEVFRPKTGDFAVRNGPVFHNIILADEINRAPSKVQSALLEAMQEKQVTIGETTFDLPRPFMVLATQNPIEQEGTYPLPEAQVDRFMFKLGVDYPSKDEEKRILNQVGFEPEARVSPVIDPGEIEDLFDLVRRLRVDDKVKDYMVDLVSATRRPDQFGMDIGPYIHFGASPRATICLSQAARARAFLDGRAFVTPQDVKNVGYPVLRHRVILSYEAEAEDMSPADELITRIFDVGPGSLGIFSRLRCAGSFHRPALLRFLRPSAVTAGGSRNTTMLTPEMVRKIKKIHIKSRRLVNTVTAGALQVPFSAGCRHGV